MAIVMPPQPHPPGRPMPRLDSTTSGPARGVRLIAEACDAHRVKPVQIQMHDLMRDGRWSYSVWCRDVFTLATLALAMHLPEPVAEAGDRWGTRGVWADCDVRLYAFVSDTVSEVAS